MTQDCFLEWLDRKQEMQNETLSTNVVDDKAKIYCGFLVVVIGTSAVQQAAA